MISILEAYNHHIESPFFANDYQAVQYTLVARSWPMNMLLGSLLGIESCN